MTVDHPMPLWTPLHPDKSQLAQFQNYVGKKYKGKFGSRPQQIPQRSLNELDTYEQFWQWSTTHVAQFWFEVFQYLHINCQNPQKLPDAVVDQRLPMFPRPT